MSLLLETKFSGFALETSNYLDFAANACLVPIVRDRSVRTGPGRWLCHDNYEQPDALGTLRRFVRHCMNFYEEHAGIQLQPVEANEFMGASVSRFLDRAVIRCDDLFYGIGPRDHALVLYRDDNGYFAGRSREQVLGAVWLLERGDGARS